MKNALAKFKKIFGGQLDLTDKHLFRNLIVFTLPIVLLTTLQLIYTEADQIVVNYYGGGYKSFVAVSANNPLINLLIGLFVGIAVGANIVIAKARGAGDKEKAERSIQSAILLSIIFGGAAGILGFFVSPYLLDLMKVDPEVKPLATTYLRVYFIGLPFLMIFNYGSSALRALGDSKRPLYVLIICGLLNVGLNFLFVIPCQLDVLGVALATIICEFFQAVLVIVFLVHNKKSFARFHIRKFFSWHGTELREILWAGIPAGAQSLVFTLSNVFIQTFVNGFGLTATAGNSASMQAEAFIYTMMNGFSVAVVSITAQNYGAKNERNLRRILWYSMGTVAVLGLAVGLIFTLLRSQLISIFLNERSVDNAAELAEAKDYGMRRLTLVCMTYFLCGIMDTEAAYCRGLGHTTTPTLIALFGACIFRIVFMETLFRFVPFFHKIEWIWATWTMSWLITDAAYWIVIPRYRKKAFAEIARDSSIS